MDGKSTPFYFLVDSMKRTVAAFTLLLVLCYFPAYGEAFRLDVGHFDPQGGLTMNSDHQIPLPDGCLGQVIEDVAEGGIIPPAPDGSPGSGNTLLRERNATDALPFVFAVNGAARLSMPGCFLIEPGFASAQMLQHRIFIRVWNSADAQQATGYWDSPLYSVLPGVQQMSFLRSEWCFNGFTPQKKPDVPIAASHSLKAFPNPFNSSSRISFELTENEHVRLTIYDLQARHVATLLDGSLTAGEHDLVFDGRTLPSGLYFLRLQAGKEFTQVTRLLLIR